MSALADLDSLLSADFCLSLGPMLGYDITVFPVDGRIRACAMDHFERMVEFAGHGETVAEALWDMAGRVGDMPRDTAAAVRALQEFLISATRPGPWVDHVRASMNRVLVSAGAA